MGIRVSLAIGRNSSLHSRLPSLRNSANDTVFNAPLHLDLKSCSTNGSFRWFFFVPQFAMFLVG